MKRLEKKIVCITGASAGIGEACARVFAEGGAKLLLCARREDRLQALATELKEKYGTEIYTFALDVRAQSQVEQAFSHLPAAWQSIDILVNNAGLSSGLDLVHEADVEDWEVMIDTNIKGLLYVTRAVSPGMVERNSGHIINLGSIAGREAYRGGSVYCATKHAVRAFTHAFRMDLLAHGVRVSSIDPGFVETEFSLVRFKGDKARAAQVYRGMTPLTSDDIADAVYYAATRPAHVNVSEILIMPTDQASITQINRRQE